MYKLKITIASTRPGRKGPVMAAWIFELAKKRQDFNVELLDLNVINEHLFSDPFTDNTAADLQSSATASFSTMNLIVETISSFVTGRTIGITLC